MLKYSIILGVTASLVGVLCGIGGVFFQYALIQVLQFVYGSSAVVATLMQWPWWLVVLVPTIGGLVTGVIIHYTRTREAIGEGVPALTVALEKEHGLIRYRVAPVKLLATLATIGSGGSAGREGPVVHMGAAVGSLIAQLTRLRVFDRETLLLAGAAAAMAATFGTPAAALVFVAEVFRRQMTFGRALLLVITVVAAMIVARGIFGFAGLKLPVPTIITTDGWALAAALVVGLVAGLVAATFSALLHTVARVSERTIRYHWLRPGVGGFLVGWILLFVPQVHEAATYQLLQDMSTGAIPIVVVGLVLLAKVCATSITIGSGGSGGVFAPALIIGTLIGALVQLGIGALGVSVSSQLLLVGMAAAFAGITHAPITAVFLLYELTDIAALVPSLLMAAVAAVIVARSLSRRSAYNAPH
jgi:chloride channel protein, CIC family